MFWTKKWDEFCLSIHLRPSSKLLLSWIVRRVPGNLHPAEIEIDLRKFNLWVAKKRGKEYDRKTLRLAISQILELTQGLVVELKQVSWFFFRLMVKPLSYLAVDKSPTLGHNSQSKSSKQLSNHQHSDQGQLQQQQNIIHLDNLLQKVGLKFDFAALVNIWRLSGRCLNRISQAIQLLLYRHQTAAILNPHGFLIECLKHHWQDGFDLYYQPELPRFNSLGELRRFVHGLSLTS